MAKQREDWVPFRFIDEEISVRFDQPPILIKRPSMPDAFTWRDQEYEVCKMLSAWTRFERRGHMARNMSLGHLRSAARRGSWGVGRFYFRVQTSCGRAFDLYYDRAPKHASDRSGHWFAWRELKPA